MRKLWPSYPWNSKQNVAPQITSDERLGPRGLPDARESEFEQEQVNSANRIAKILVRQYGANTKNEDQWLRYNIASGRLFVETLNERIDYEISLLRGPMIEGDIGWWPNPYRLEMTEADL